MKKFLPATEKNEERLINKCNIKNLNSNLIPKFRGCGPGGANSSLMAKSIESGKSSNRQHLNI